MGRSSLPAVLLVVLCWSAAGAQQPDTTKVRHRLPNPTAAMIRSFLLPGWGQWYNGKKCKAGLFFAAELGLISYALYQDDLAARSTTYEDRFYHEDRRNLAFWWMAGTALVAGLDAYVDAHLAGFDVSENLSLVPRWRSGFEVALRWQF